jgi:hypothetical protein
VVFTILILVMVFRPTGLLGSSLGERCPAMAADVATVTTPPVRPVRLKPAGLGWPLGLLAAPSSSSSM